VWSIADTLFPAGARVLDAGCGAGDDAIHLAQRGVRVTAIDIAPGMIERVMVKAEAAGFRTRITAHITDFENFRGSEGAFYGLLSNFAALNCVEHLDGFRTFAARVLRPGAPLLLVTFGTFYLPETLLFLLKGDMRRAFRRLRRNADATVEGIRFPVWYHSVKDLRRGLGPDFSLREIRGLPSVEAPFSNWPAMGRWSDHFVSIWRYR
jgi:ubiquinone/menaquinone biosynthesis C-methylase UbiE